MKCEIIRENQETLAVSTVNTTLLQDSRYGAAMAATSGFHPVNTLIYIDNKPAGRALLLEVRAFFGLIHGITLDRGPLWFEGYGGAHHIKAFLDALNRLYPARPLRRRRLIPEIEDSPVARKMIESAGFTRIGAGYATFLLALDPPVEGLRAGLEQKWRNILNRAERVPGISVDWDDAARQLPWFVKIYEQDKRRKNYDGPSPQFLTSLAPLLSSSRDMMIGRVIKDGAAISAVLIIRHGDTATYLAGWTGEAGRSAGAHHLLMWSACGMLKEKGVKFFDLGGFNEQDAKAIQHFKKGMGGRSYCLAGRYA